MRTITALLVLLASAGAAAAGDLVPTDARFGPLRVASHKVDVTVDNQIALTRVEQIFANDHPAMLEAHYVFPVPKGASIIDFSMTVNGKLVRGELLEKDRARSIYEGIVRQSKDPGLLEHVGANLFRVRVFPILPNTQQKIEMTYVERVAYDNGLCRHVYPLLVPGGAKTTRADHFEFRWRLSSAVPIKDVVCPTHPAAVARQAQSAAEVRFSGRQVDLSRDLDIEYRIERESSGMDLVTHRPAGGEDGTFMLLLTPQANAARLPKDMTFVFDTSGSMEGARIKQAKAALRFCLSKLQPDDRFNILSFASRVTAFSAEHVAADDDAKDRARRFVDGLDATGGTNINESLLRALEHRAPAGRPHLVMFLTDGEPTSGETSPAAIVRNVSAANRAGVRIFAFGVGADLNRGLLEDLADATHGVAEFVSDQENIEEKVSRLQKKISTPVISEIEIDWGKAEVSAVYPRSPGDLFAGTQLMIMGRYRKAGTFDVSLKGRAGERKVEIKQALTFPEQIDVAPAVPYLWAMRKIASLLDDVRRGGANPEVLQQVIALSKQYRIATPYTSFLVLESEAAYDQHGIERKGNTYKAPTPVVAAPSSGTPHAVGVNRPNPVVVQVDRQRYSFERKGIPKDDQVAQPSDEPAIYFPATKESDHHESSDGEDYKQMKADSKDFLSYTRGDAGGFRGRQAGKNPGVYDTMGVGVGGRFGGRFGGRENLVARGGGTRATESAVLAALKWLAHHQNPDGGWSADTYDARCAGTRCVGGGEKDNDVGVTSLSVLAFLGAGYSQLSKDEYPDPAEPGRVLRFGEVVKKGLQWLLSRQDPEGCVGERGSKHLYSHAIAALALSEALGMTASQPLQSPCQKAVDFLVAAQNPGKGWRYHARGGDNDTSVTGWAVLALKSAELAELTFPKTAFDGAIVWFDEATDAKGRTGYTSNRSHQGFQPGRGEVFDHHETMTAVSMWGRIAIQKRKSDPRLSAAATLLVSDLPEWKGNKIDFNYWHFGTQALFQHDGPDGPIWKKWNEPMKNALIPAQKTGKDGCANGSWEPASRWADEGGRVWSTAINALTLEIYYRYANTFGTR